MKAADELITIPPNHAIWRAYDPAVKAELYSTAIESCDGFVLVDPIALADSACAQLRARGLIAGVIVTNANHARAAMSFTANCELFIPAELATEFPQAKTLTDSINLFELTAMAVNGAGPGEFALYDARDGGTMIIGDALINFGSNGFDLLPAKYCTSRKQMVRSLRRLLQLPFTRMFFAHGEPITTRAHERLRILLENCS